MYKSGRSFAIRRSTASRMKTYTLLFVLKIAQHKSIQNLIIMTDCNYVSNTYTNEWYKKWFEEKDQFPYSNLLKQIKDLKSPSYREHHCLKDAFPFHSFVDRVAKGQFDISELGSSIFNSLKKLGILLSSENNIEDFIDLLK